MRCYTHPDHEAVGICKNCHKGICSLCAAIVDDSLACKDRCEAKVAHVNKLLSKAGTSYQVASSVQRRAGIMLFCLAAILGLLAASLFRDGTTAVGWVFAAIAVLFFVLGLKAFKSAREMSLSGAIEKTEL